MKVLPALTFACLTAAVALILTGCAVDSAPLSHGVSRGGAPRNVILIIGDGMGPQQVAVSEIYWRRTDDQRAAPLHRFLSKATNGIHIPLPERSLVNDSACAASQLAGGCRCEPQQIGLDIDGARCQSLVHAAKKAGLRVGLISDTRITHATPAAFYGHVRDREEEFKLAEQLIEADADVAFSGGADFFLPAPIGERSAPTAGATSCYRSGWGRRGDGADLLSRAQARGATVVCSSAELARARDLPVLGLFAPQYMANAFREGEGVEPTLAQMTERALSLLENPSGFFLMVESWQIDTAAHYNDAGWVFAEMLRLSSVLRVIERFVERHPETLVVLTADHETGGMGFSYRRAEGAGALAHAPKRRLDFLSDKHLELLNRQTASISDVLSRHNSLAATAKTDGEVNNRDLQRALRDATRVTIAEVELSSLLSQRSKQNTDSAVGMGEGCSHGFYPYDNFMLAGAVARRISAAQGVAWATGTHTSTPINVLAHGPGAERFQGWLTAKEVGQRLLGAIEPR